MRTEATRNRTRNAAEEVEDEVVMAMIEAHRRLVKAVRESRDCIRAYLEARGRREARA